MCERHSSTKCLALWCVRSCFSKVPGSFAANAIDVAFPIFDQPARLCKILSIFLCPVSLLVGQLCKDISIFSLYNVWRLWPVVFLFHSSAISISGSYCFSHYFLVLLLYSPWYFWQSPPIPYLGCFYFFLYLFIVHILHTYTIMGYM